ncbi:TPA: hypothetical protein RNS88_002252 [Stenotrophomonas maltophilia]|nr:hypothetical protein [Stenotrophomonas maltophilia]
MNALAELLDAVRERSGLPSDMALATKLGIQRQTLHQARKGVAGLSDERIAQLCELGKLDGAVWLAKIHAERATSPVERRVWRSVLDRLSAAAAVLVLAVIAMPGAARAKAIDSQGFSGSGQPHSVYYVSIGLGRTSGLAATTSALCLLKTSLRSLCVGRPSAPSLTVDIKVNRLHLPPDMTNQQHDEQCLAEILGILNELTSEKPLSLPSTTATWPYLLERSLLIAYVGVLVITAASAVVTAATSLQEPAEPYLQSGFFTGFVLVVAYILSSLVNAVIANRRARKDPTPAMLRRMRRDTIQDWKQIQLLRAFPKHLVEYALTQYKWHWDMLEQRVGLFSGDLRRLGLAPALAGSALAAANLIRQEGVVLLWAPIAMACCLYIVATVLLASRERPRQVVELLSFLIKSWESLSPTPMPQLAPEHLDLPIALAAAGQSQEPVHHKDIHQAQRPMPERLR